MSDEIRQSAEPRGQPSAKESAPSELSELRASARVLRERVERLEAQLQQAEELDTKMRIRKARQNGKLSTTREQS